MIFLDNISNPIASRPTPSPIPEFCIFPFHFWHFLKVYLIDMAKGY